MITYKLLYYNLGISKNKNYKHPKKIMRIITLNTYNSHTEPLFKNLKLLKIEDYIKVTRNKILFYIYS